MNKTSTLLYSIHNLSSRPNQQFIPQVDLDGISEYKDVVALLNSESGPVDIRQDVIEKILAWADKQT